MSLETTEKSATHSPRGWLDKLSHVLSREPQDREQLIALLQDAKQRDLLSNNALKMIENVLQVSDTLVSDVMIPRSQMVVIEEHMAPKIFLPLITESGHSRFPVTGNNRDEVIGILLAKDLLTFFSQHTENEFNIHDFLRPAIFIPESKRVDILLQEFQSRRYHMAIVVNEYGGVAGLVTIEDILEQIVGDIEDEYDIGEDHFIKKQTENQFMITAVTPIEEFNQYFGTQFSDAEFDTIGGLVMQQFGYLPKQGEQISIADFNFEIIQADNRRIRLLKLTR